jgi:hypothetical protein
LSLSSDHEEKKVREAIDGVSAFQDRRQDRCIVCNGSRTWRGSSCWCCSPGSHVCSDVCSHCGGSGDEYGNRLLPLGVIDVGVLAMVHARCWADFRADFRADRNDGFGSGPSHFEDDDETAAASARSGDAS